MTRSPAPLALAVALVVGLGLTLVACSDEPSSESEAESDEAKTPSSPDTTTTPEWTRIDDALSGMGPEVGFLAASVSPDGTCQPIHEVASSEPRPTASQFKLFVLGALADQVAAGQVSWDQTVTVEEATKSLGNGEGSLQAAAPGTELSVEEAATKMISISDNTAADLLAGLVGRPAVEDRFDRWTENAAANEPFLTTREMFLLHYVPDLADRYLATPREQREAFLDSSIDPRPLTDIDSHLLGDPRYIDEVEWFASPHDICRAFAGLQVLAEEPSLAPLPTVLSREVGGIGLDPSAWPTVWFKGGSEPGVLTLGWLATDSHGESFVVEAMVANPDANLADSSIQDLVNLAKEAFGLLG